jgi:hypothetical protein
MGPVRIIERQPNSLLLVDRNGTIVYRNEVATAMAQQLSAERGDQVVEALRAAIAQICQTVRTFPHTQTLDVSHGGVGAQIEFRISDLPEGFLVSWRDVTTGQDRVQVLEKTADDLAALSDSYCRCSATGQGRLDGDVRAGDHDRDWGRGVLDQHPGHHRQHIVRRDRHRQSGGRSR